MVLKQQIFNPEVDKQVQGRDVPILPEQRY